MQVNTRGEIDKDTYCAKCLSSLTLVLLVSGHYVPQLSQVIAKYNLDTKQDSINLKGYMVCIPFLHKN
jgi:hypothetical protein